MSSSNFDFLEIKVANFEVELAVNSERIANAEDSIAIALAIGDYEAVEDLEYTLAVYREEHDELQEALEIAIAAIEASIDDDSSLHDFHYGYADEDEEDL